MNLWLLAALLNFSAALAHIGIVLGGPAWYRFFGAGEAMAQMAERQHPWPVIVTLGIASVLAIWGAFALALGKLIDPLPFMALVGLVVTSIYTVRGVLPFLAMPFFRQARTPFWVWSSVICSTFAIT